MSEQQIVTSVSVDGSSATVAISGTLTIDLSSEFHQALADAFKSAQRVALDARRLQKIDLTTLQIICSACKTASAQQRSFVLEGEPPDCVQTLCKEIGASQNAPCCCLDAKKPCIWFGGAR
jgi:anti-anti-sigma regulatory factor